MMLIENADNKNIIFKMKYLKKMGGTNDIKKITS